MKWDNLVRIARELPVIQTEDLLVGDEEPVAMAVQVTRWHKQGKLIQLKRGVYLLAEPYRKTEVFEPYIASTLKKPSYISLEKALEYHGLIPEGVPVFTSVTTKNPAVYVSAAGTFDYRHIKRSLFWGYASVTLKRQTAFMATPEKALLDLIYLRRPGVSTDYLDGLRLQNLEIVDTGRLLAAARKFKKKNILRAANLMKRYIESEKKKEIVL